VFSLNITFFLEVITNNLFVRYMVKNMDEKKVKLSCVACGTEYWAEGANYTPALDAPQGSLVPYACPICQHEESKVEE
jgi:Zn finger protein HypA/HybF involved in hydrogenase expression